MLLSRALRDCLVVIHSSGLAEYFNSGRETQHSQTVTSARAKLSWVEQLGLLVESFTLWGNLS